MVDKGGVPLAIRNSRATASDRTQILPLAALGFLRVVSRPGRPDQSPDTVDADAGHDSGATWRLLRYLGIEPRIRRRRMSRGSGLGKARWVVERTTGWLKELRRIRVRYDRSDHIIETWKSLAMSIIGFRILES